VGERVTRVRRSSGKETIMAEPRTDADGRIHDEQEVETGHLSEDEKLDIALQGSMMTSEPPQMAEPKQAADRDEAED
jgi:hypothetical protein